MSIVRRPHLLLAVITVLCCVSQAQAGETLSFVPTPPVKSANRFYTQNRQPLTATPLIKLPIGAIRPEGWLRRQLELTGDGFTGRLAELSEFLKTENNAWLSPAGAGKYGWEELPYWLKGYVDLAYVMQDQKMIAESRRWIEGILSSQRPDGYFGPESNLPGLDIWPNMCALYALRSYYDATGDKRVLPFMSRYFKWQMTIPLERLLRDSWQKIRGGDNLDSIHWLYNRTGEKWLLEAARVNHERTSDWTGWVASWHGVNIGECFREPAQFYQQTGDIRYLKAAERNYAEVMESYGQVPGGGFGSDENCRAGYTGPRQGTETCTWAELMFSDEILTGITGNPVWADRCEEIAFNSLPASMTPDLKGLHYLTAPNQVQLDHADKAPLIQNGGEMFNYNPYYYRCCQHNVAMAWPYFAEHLWMATRDNGLAAVMYAANEATAKVGGETTVKIVQQTDYPFGESVRLGFAMSEAVRFPLYLRIPGWCEKPAIKVNGELLSPKNSAHGWAVIDRKWADGDILTLDLPMRIRVRTWEKNRGTVSVYRGPLAYSLLIKEQWKRYGGTDNWPGYEVFANTPWNYGLVLDAAKAESSFEVASLGRPTDMTDGPSPRNQPFQLIGAPIALRAKARRIPEWKMESNGMVGEVVQGPIKSAEPIEEITLVPMGCARLRITAFPRIGDGPDAKSWGEKP